MVTGKRRIVTVLLMLMALCLFMPGCGKEDTQEGQTEEAFSLTQEENKFSGKADAVGTDYLDNGSGMQAERLEKDGTQDPTFDLSKSLNAGVESQRQNINPSVEEGMEILQGKPLGGLVLRVEGEPENRQAAIDYLRQHNVRVEVIERG